MKIIRSLDELKSYRASIDSLAFVPTMGALHDGHLSLIQAAKQHSDHVLMSIFINPTQFSQGEDFNTYPRNVDADLDQLKDLGVDVWLPDESQIYPLGAQNSLRLYGYELTSQYCGETRPIFFDGVLTVLLRFLLHLRPHYLVMGEKDFQQQFLVQKMIQDFGFDTQLIQSKLIREASGLAMSSRNQYLSEQERVIAATIYQSLLSIESLFQAGQRSVKVLKEAALNTLHPELKLDYLHIVCETSLRSYDEDDELPDRCRVLIAVYLNAVRLIDTKRISNEPDQANLI